MGVFNPGIFNPGVFNVGGGAPAVEAAASVVLFPADGLRFRSRWDKTMYSWAVFARDMRAPTDGFRPMKDHLVSAVSLARR